MKFTSPRRLFAIALLVFVFGAPALAQQVHLAGVKSRPAAGSSTGAPNFDARVNNTTALAAAAAARPAAQGMLQSRVPSQVAAAVRLRGEGIAEFRSRTPAATIELSPGTLAPETVYSDAGSADDAVVGAGLRDREGIPAQRARDVRPHRRRDRRAGAARRERQPVRAAHAARAPAGQWPPRVPQRDAHSSGRARPCAAHAGRAGARCRRRCGARDRHHLGVGRARIRDALGRHPARSCRDSRDGRHELLVARRKDHGR